MTTWKKMFSLFGAIALMCTFGFATGQKEGAKVEKVELKLAHVGSPASPQQSIGKIFVEKVSTKTGGSVAITIFDSGTLGNEKFLQEGVRSGTVDIAIAGTFSHVLPWAGILETPTLFRNMDHFVGVFSSKLGEAFITDFEKELGVKTLFIAPHGGFRYITTKAKAIKKPADMQGLKLRNPNVPAYNIMANAVGAIPIPLDFAELYVALDRGVVDGQHDPTGHIVGSKFYEVQRYLNLVPWGITPHVVCMSKRAWDKLNSAQQKAVMEAARETIKEYPAVAAKEEQEQLNFLKDKMTIIRAEEIDIQAFSAVLQEKGLPALEKEYPPQGVKWVKEIINFK
ncbi:MAG: DctP family TRAP transporter solute-binding subunit [Spirochaetales bacterium]